MSQEQDPEGTDRLGKPGFAEEALPHLDAVYRFALRLVGGATDQAEDLVQETFLRAYRSWETYRRGSNARSWLFTIARNAYLRGREQAARRPETPVSQYDFLLETAAVDPAQESEAPPRPDQAYFDSSIDHEVLAAVDALPPEFREAVVLADLQALPYAEIAEVLGIPLGTVKSRLYRGRRLLYHALKRYAREEGYLRAPPAGLARGLTPELEP